MTPWMRAGLAAGVVATFAAGAGAQTLPDGPHAVPMALPACSASDPEVRIIDEPADWAAVADPALRVFCVRPGDYSSVGTIVLRTSGTPERPRILRYEDPGVADPPHPVKQTFVERAIVSGIALRGASHWRIDGLTIQRPGIYGVEIRDAHHHVLNRLLVQDGENSLVRLIGESSHNVIQNSVIRRTVPAPSTDRVCVSFESPLPGQRQQGNRLVQNEIYDCTDGVQLHLPTQYPAGGHLTGLRIADNDVYLTPARYTDCRGRLDPAGPCACAENGIDVKIGGLGDGPDDAVTISGNRLWGWRETDHGPRGNDTNRCGGSGSWGDMLTVHTEGAHVAIQGNRFLDGSRGVWLASEARSVRVVANAFHRIADGLTQEAFAIGTGGDDTEIHGNVVVDSERWLILSDLAERTAVTCNVLVDSEGMGARPAPPGTHFERNTFYGTEPSVATSSDDAVYPGGTVPAEPLCFWRKRWTGPEQVCIPHAIAAPADALTQSCSALRSGSAASAPAAPAMLP